MPSFKNTMNTPEIQRLLSEYQTGVPTATQDEIPSISGSATPAQQEQPTQPSLYQQAMRMPIGRGLAESNIEEALASGYGTSKYDTDYYPGMDLEHNRALEQSGFSKIGTGLVKGGITAATTAVNTVAGTVWGLGSALYELALDANGNGRSFMDTLDAGTNNWLSGKMTNIQSWAEEALPNYRTEQERTEEYQREWYKHMGSANFIGDSILKNYGFTVGAVGGGKVWSKLIGAAMSKRLANNVMKGVVAASEGDAEASAGMQRAAEAINRGTAAAVDAEKLAYNIQNAAKQINRMSARLQLYGSVIGAMGEGTVEGQMARQEFLDEYNAELQDRYAREYDNLENEILATGNKYWVENRVVQQPDGTLATVPTLTEDGRKHLRYLQLQTTEKYQDLMNKAEVQGDRLATTTFLLNLPILTTSNLVQFGRMFSGGWQTNRANLSAVRGKATVATPATPEGKPKISADYKPKSNKIGRTILNSLKVAGSESFEEMAQGTVSSGAKQVAGARLSAFNDDGYDDGSTRTARFWFENMYQGGVDYLGDVKNWQEGALGALTGLFGMPGKRWGGGVFEAYHDAKEEIKSSRKAANELNTLVNSKEFQDRWHGYIRHLKYDNDMQSAIENDDEYSWHTADDAQLISDIMLFANAGRLEDLNQIVSTFAKMSEEDVAGIREVMKNSENESADWTKNLSDQEVMAKVSKQAKKMQDTIKEYKDIYDALAARAPIGASPEFLEEMVFTAMQIKAFDRRFMEMLGETLDGIEPYLLAMSSVEEDGTIAPAGQSSERYKNLRDNYERLFAGSLLPMRVPAAVQKAMDSSLDLLEEITTEDEELNKKVKDMRALSKDRMEFYRKLQTLQGESGQKKFEYQAVTSEKVEEAAEQAYARQETEGLKTMNDVKQAYFSKDAKGRADFLNTIAPLEESNSAIKEFMKLKRRADAFRAYIDSKGINTEDMTVTPQMINSALNDLIRRAKSEEEFINLPDNVFSSLDEFIRDYTGPFGAPSAATHASVKNAIRQAMTDYMAAETGTASRKAIDPNYNAPQPVEGTVITPTGYDAAQPASAVPPPASPQPSAQPAPTTPTSASSSPAGEQTKGAAPLPEWMTQGSEEPAERQQQGESAQPSAEAVASGASARVEEDVQPVQAPNPVTLARDAGTAAADETPEGAESEKVYVKGQKSKLAYYRTSVPEVDSGEAAKARAAIKRNDSAALEKVDLSDFVLKHPEYAEIWNALAQRNAFANVATQLEKDDLIEFVVDPTFPTYKGQYQVLMTVVKDGQRLVLNVLSGQTSQYHGLSELRAAIDKEYKAFREQHPNEMFVFSKKSRVWAKRPGLIDYDFSGTEEKGIVNIPGYDDNAPIVFINRKGDAVLVKGNNPDAIKQVNDDFANANENNYRHKLGNLYYLVKVGKEKYIPIRLNVEHFRVDNKNSEYPVFRKIREILENMAQIVKEANSENYGEQNTKLHEQLRELVKYLDIHEDFFEIGEYENVGVALRYSSPSNASTMRRPDQMTGEWMTNFMAKLGRSIQIRTENANDIFSTIQEYIETGLITSNARMLRPKGVDFYIHPWDSATGEFLPATNSQQLIETQRIESISEEVQPAPEEVAPADVPVPAVDDFYRRDMLDDPYDTEPAHGESAPQERSQTEQEKAAGQEHAESLSAKATAREAMVRKKFSEHSANIQEALKAKGYTEEEFDAMGDLLKEKVLTCLGV